MIQVWLQLVTNIVVFSNITKMEHKEKKYIKDTQLKKVKAF